MKATLVIAKSATLIVMDDQVVEVGRSPYQAAEIAKQLGATELEVFKWREFFSQFTLSASVGQGGASRATNRRKEQEGTTGSTK